jgi:hypothetical protein
MSSQPRAALPTPPLAASGRRNLKLHTAQQAWTCAAKQQRTFKLEAGHGCCLWRCSCPPAACQALHSK